MLPIPPSFGPSGTSQVTKIAVSPKTLLPSLAPLAWRESGQHWLHLRSKSAYFDFPQSECLFTAHCVQVLIELDKEPSRGVNTIIIPLAVRWLREQLAGLFVLPQLPHIQTLPTAHFTHSPQYIHFSDRALSPSPNPLSSRHKSTHGKRLGLNSFSCWIGGQTIVKLNKRSAVWMFIFFFKGIL